jgi:hypothetical protein
MPEARDHGFWEMSSEGDQAMKMTKGMLWLILAGILVLGLVTKPDLWAAPGQSPARQTVPTRTPEQPPTPEPTKKPKPENPDPATMPEVTPTAPPVAAEGASVPLLPDAGGWSIHLQLGAAMLVAGFLLLVMAGRQA